MARKAAAGTGNIRKKQKTVNGKIYTPTVILLGAM